MVASIRPRLSQEKFAGEIGVVLATLTRGLRGERVDRFVAEAIDGAVKKRWPEHPSLIIPDGPPPNPDAVPYLEKLWNETREIEIKNLRTSDTAANKFDIDEIYTPLTTVLAPLGHEPVPLQEALRAQTRVLLEGKPGTGKSTYIKRIAFEAAHVRLGKAEDRPIERLLPDPVPFPILVKAPDFANHLQGSGPQPAPLSDPGSSEWLVDFLGRTHSALGAEFFRRELKDGCLLLVDSLDEVGESKRGTLGEVLKRFAGDAEYSKTRVLATSRPGAFGGLPLHRSGDGRSDSGAAFHRVEIGPLDRSARKTFAEKWGRAVHRQDSAAASALTSQLLTEIEGKREIRNMAENPLMLTALACLHFVSPNAKLPEQRSELYRSVLEWLAKAAELRTGVLATVHLERMRSIAYAMHAGEPDMRTDIGHEEAVKLIAEEFFQEERSRSRRVEKAGAFLRGEEANSGIIVYDGMQLRFWHRTFQEWLAAHELTLNESERNLRLFGEGRVHEGSWRETVLLLAGDLKGTYGDRPINAFLTAILNGAGKDGLRTQIQRAGLMGAILRDLGAWKYKLPWQLDARYQETLNQALAIFDRDKARQFSFDERLAAAEALGAAGDPRIGREDNWIEVKGGRFWIGAQSKDRKGRNYDPEACDREGPVREVAIEPFVIAKYPVTVSEFQQFMDADGYEREEFWRSGGGFGQFSEPDGWEWQNGHGNWPVIGVSWYEASAYCAWRGLRLPTEAEWECAARCGREGVRYPWGPEDPGAHRANYFCEGSPKVPTPVGLYPECATPNGIEDMAGNVPEWTGSGHKEDSYSVRGGAWYDAPGLLRVSFGLRYAPGQRGSYFGFRCVREN